MYFALKLSLNLHHLRCFSAYPPRPDPQRDWHVLGTAALQAMNFEVGKKAFIRLRDVQSVDVLSEIEMRSIHEAALAKIPEARCEYPSRLCVESVGYEGRGGGQCRARAKNGKTKLPSRLLGDMVDA